jgi:hypothetical protein
MVDLSGRIHEDEAGPAQMSRQGSEPLGRAEPDQDKPDRRVVVLFLHLDQVLLTRNSMPVSHRHDVHAPQIADVARGSVRCVDNGEPAQGYVDVLTRRHVGRPFI